MAGPPAHLITPSLTTPLPEAEFSAVYAEAAEGGSSSGGELSDIAAQYEESQAGSLTPARLPRLQTRPGRYQFSLTLPSSPRKPKEAQYSKITNKLYICQNIGVTASLHFTHPGPPTHLHLRAWLVFTSPDCADKPVSVCYAHSHNATGKRRDELATHLLRLQHDRINSKYYRDNSGQHYVHLDEPLPADTGPLLVTLRFTDLSSCSGGINRRDVGLVVSLEEDGESVGSALVPVRVCTSPKRDREAEEKQLRPVRKTTSQYWVLATNQDNYEALMKVGEVLERTAGGDVETWTEEVKKRNKKQKTETPSSDRLTLT